MSAEKSNVHLSGGSFRTQVWKALFFCFWIGAVVMCFGRLLAYELAPGKMGGSQTSPNGLIPESNGPSILLALHPKCPCSRASIAELLEIFSRAPQKPQVIALLFKPAADSEDWTVGEMVDSLKLMGARLVLDEEGTLAKSAGLLTSGHVRIYGSRGDLLFDGGVTGGRGHRGDNDGKSAVLDLLRSGKAGKASAPVFGCSFSSSVEK